MTEPIVHKRTFAQIADDLSTYHETLEFATDEDTKDLIKRHIESIGQELITKTDNLAAVLRRLDADTEEIKAEEKRLQAKRKTAERARQWLEGYVMATMRENHISQLKTALNTLSIQKNGGIEPMQTAAPELIPDEYCDVLIRMTARGWSRLIDCELDADLAVEIQTERVKKIERIPQNEIIRKALKDGKQVSGARLLPRGEHLRIL